MHWNARLIKLAASSHAAGAECCHLRAVETKLLELLNMRGRHRHKWDFLRSLLDERVVYDDNAFRVWYAPGTSGTGLLFAAKQAQVRP